MTRLRRVAAVAALSTGLAMGTAVVSSAQGADTVVARVGGSEITLGHMVALRQRLPQQYLELEDQALWDGILEQLIQQAALAQTVETASRRVELTLENERRALVANEAVQAMIEDAVTDETIQAAYEAAYSSDEPAIEFNASHILVETEQEAQSIVDDLDAGADFADLARSQSTGPSGPSGGELGWFGPGAMVPSFDQAVQEMDVGEIAGPVQTQFGWHVIKLNDKRQTDAPALDTVRGELEDQIREKAVSDLLQAITREVDVEKTALDPSLLRDDSILED